MGILTVSFDRLNILFEIPLSSDPSIRPTDFLKSTSYIVLSAFSDKLTISTFIELK